MSSVPMTVEGHSVLKEELRRLKSEDRPSIIQQIAEARAHGDISENAEYHAAKERQGFIEARIKDLEIKLGRAQVVDPSTLSGDKVLFGATVTILLYDGDEKQTWQIVGDDESDTKRSKIGVSSPIARAMIGRHEGEEIKIQSPKGTREGEILKVEFR
jgi:transcription elongation factor GreA